MGISRLLCCGGGNRVVPLGSPGASLLNTVSESGKNERLQLKKSSLKIGRRNKVSPAPEAVNTTGENATTTSSSKKAVKELPFADFDLSSLPDVALKPCTCMEQNIEPKEVKVSKKSKRLFDSFLRKISCGKANSSCLNPFRFLKKKKQKKEEEPVKRKCVCRDLYPEQKAVAAFHQASKKDLPNGIELTCPGFSCASQALTAAFWHFHQPVTSWGEETLNDIIVEADQLHYRTLEAMGEYIPDDGMLTLDEIATKDRVFGLDFEIDPTTFVYGGNQFMHVEGFPTIEGLVDEMIQRKKKGAYVLRFLVFTVAILIEENGDIYLFDSHERDEYGAPTTNGRCRLFKFKRASNLAVYLMAFSICGMGAKIDDEEDSSYEMREIQFLQGSSDESSGPQGLQRPIPPHRN